MAFERQHPNESNAWLSPLPEPRARTVFLLAALLRRTEKLSGFRFHDLLHRWITSGAETLSEQGDWLRENGVRLRSLHHQMDAAQREVDQWLGAGAWCLEWPPPGSRRSDSVVCPRYIFGSGSLEGDTPWIGFFNSRTPRLRAAGEEWLNGLRYVLPQVAASKLGLASSFGTLTYDLITAYGQKANLPLLLWLPTPLEIFLKGGARAPFAHPFRASLQLTCLTRAVDCAASTRAVCRDRMLAELTDLHCLLSIRAGGNMQAILHSLQTEAPRPRWVMHRPSRDSRRCASSPDSMIPSELPEQTTLFVVPELPNRRESGTSSRQKRPMNVKSLHEVDWGRVLCHYTRSCVGPWPGQLYEDYLAELLDDAPHSRHSAFDTLIRVLGEGRIRASAKLLRGNEPAISFTSIAPAELARMRQWNKALARWTVEPYGFGIDKAFLKRAGARPVVYGPVALYEKLKERDRFRFQKHQPPTSFWKHEREWRLPRDLVIDELPINNRLVFVPTEMEACDLAARVGAEWLIVVLDK